jgi:hypothetical protein
MRRARLNWPPISSRLEQRDRVAALGGDVAQARPAGPAPTTAMRFARAARRQHQLGLVARRAG